MSSTSCQFTGTVQGVTLAGEGPAILVEPDAFNAGQGQITLQGAELYVHSPGGGSPVSSHNPTLTHWQLLQPVNVQAAGPFHAEYQAQGSGSQRQVEIQLAPGGDTGWFRGPEPGSGKCATDDGCEIHWSGPTKVLQCSMHEDLVLTGAMPMEPVKLDRVVLKDARGALTCGDKSTRGAWSEIVWQCSPTGALKIEPLKLTQAGLEVRVENDAPPKAVRASWSFWAMGAAGFFCLVALLVMFVRRARRRRMQLNLKPTPIQAAAPVRLFISYAHEDDRFRAELGAQLKALERKGLVEVWDDRRIEPGSDWEQELSGKLEQAQLAILLVSADFINSDYCTGKELKRAIELEEAGQLRIVPIIIRACAWTELPLPPKQALPQDAKPVNDPHAWSSHDEAWDNVVKGIKRAAKSMQSLAGAQSN